MIVCFLWCGCAKEATTSPEPAPAIPRLLIENFESSSHRTWQITGEAFSYELVSTSLLEEWGNAGYEGDHVMTSWAKGDGATGTMTSPTFEIEKNYINYLIGGGGDYESVYVALLVDGEEVMRESGRNSRTMSQVVWDVSPYKGKSARIKLVDQSSRAWGFIDVDYFYQSDQAAISGKKRTIKIEKSYLNFPIDPDADIGNVLIMRDGQVEYDIDLRLTDNEPDYWVYLNCDEWIGSSVELEIAFNEYLNQQHPIVSDGALQAVYQSDLPANGELFYTEPLRPRAHFTSVRGWLNDPCGLLYNGSEWHMYYQHNPFGCDWGNIHWGHAVSSDLVRWRECDDALRPDTLGSVFSGYAVLDERNVSGMGNGQAPPWITYYTAAGEYNYASRNRPFTQCMAYSCDGGVSWTKYPENPILEEIAFQNRDPHIVWSPEDSKWVMVLYLEENRYGFFESDDLLHWSRTSEITIPNEWECPDFFLIRIEDSDEYRWVLMGVQNKYYVGRFEGGVFTPETSLMKQDLGTTYLAAHTFANAPDGRRIQIGCMGSSNFTALPFNQMMAFPKELQLHRTTDNGYRLHARPVPEIVNLYAADGIAVEEVDASVSGGEFSAEGTAFHLKVSVDLNRTTADHFGFDANGVRVLYYPGRDYFVIRDGGLQTTYSANNVTAPDGIMDLEVILDTGILEAFINNGEYSATLFHLAADPAKKVSLVVEGGTARIKSLQMTGLNAFWE